MNALTLDTARRRAGLRPKLWWSLPPRIRRALTVQTTPTRRILDVEAEEALVTPAPIAAAAPEPEEWTEDAILETFEEADPQGEDSVPWVPDSWPDVIELRAPVKPDYGRFVEALRSKPRAAPVPAHEVPVELAKAEPSIGRMHTNGVYGARFELRKKGLLVDCAQCDRAVTRSEASACSSRFCKAKGL